jgi:hypothetical protein
MAAADAIVANRMMREMVKDLLDIVYCVVLDRIYRLCRIFFG